MSPHPSYDCSIRGERTAVARRGRRRVRLRNWAMTGAIHDHSVFLDESREVRGNDVVKDLALAGRALVLDLASTILFFLLYALSGNLAISIGLGIVVAAAQIGWRLFHRQQIDALQWVSLTLVVTAGSVSLMTYDPVLVMLKPTVIYFLVGCAMLQRGWMVRYMPARVMEVEPDIVTGFGYVWAGLMFFSAALNLVIATHTNVLLWGSAMSVWGIASKGMLFFFQYGFMRWMARRRYTVQTAANQVSSSTI